MNQYFNFKIAKQSAKVLDIIFFLTHIWFMYYFYTLEIDFMFAFNVVSVLYYGIGFFAIGEGKLLGPFVIIAMLEIYAHLTLATIFVGLDCGFQWVLLFLPIMFYYIEYFWLEISGKRTPVALYSFVTFITFVSLEIGVGIYGPLCEVPDWLGVPSSTSIMVLVFTMEIFLLHTLTRNTYQRERKLQDKAMLDGLTGLYNRFDVWDELDGLLQRSGLQNRWAAIIDLDDFAALNNAYGRSAGDYVILQVAEVIRRQDPDNFCARWGGDAFLICGSYVESKQEAYDAVEKIREEIHQIKYEAISEPVVTNVTVGVSFYIEGQTVKDWLLDAERRLYTGKYTGRSRTV